jgi:RluA family pseudouridine synthase
LSGFNWVVAVDGKSLRQVVKAETQWSSKQVNSAIDARQVRIDGRVEQHGSCKCRSGQRISVDKGLTGSASKGKPKEVPLAFIFQNDDYIAVDKPPGIPSQRTRDPKRITMEGLVCNWAVKEGVEDIHLAHRLDRDTSGVLVFGRGKTSTERLMDWFKHRQIQKTYYALCHGVAPVKSGTWKTHQGKTSQRGGRQAYGRVRSGGDLAVTEYEVLSSSQGFSLWRLKPKTGRTHQLRVHLSEAGFPIVGDDLYGRRSAGEEAPHHFLHAGKLALPEEAGMTAVWQATFPPAFQKALQRLAIDSPL